jgi:multicomponent Na+:H+ antiporter subunit D
VVYVFGVDTLAGLSSVEWFAPVAAFTMIAASIVALRSDNLKRRLAYSTVSQLAYVVFAAALLTPLSVVGAALHIAAHAFGKITLFFAAGAIYTAAHKTEVSELDGIGRRMPWTMAAFAVGSLSMVGLPPAAGFVSKWYMLSGAMQAGQWGAVAVIAAGTLLSAGYLLPIVYRAFLLAPAPAHGRGAEHGEAPLSMVIALVVSAAGTIALFFHADALLALSRQLAGL